MMTFRTSLIVAALFATSASAVTVPDGAVSDDPKAPIQKVQAMADQICEEGCVLVPEKIWDKVMTQIQNDQQVKQQLNDALIEEKKLHHTCPGIINGISLEKL